MSKTTRNVLIGLALFIGVIVIAAMSIFGTYVSAHDSANAQEASLVAAKQNSESILAKHGQALAEAAQVPGMAKEDIVEIAKASIQGRFNPNGENAVFNAVREHNPMVDPKLYQTLQRMVESGRNDFQRSQEMMLDRRRAYETDLGSFWTGMFMRFAGYPKLNLADYRPVSTDRASKAFETGKEDGPVKLR